MSSIRKPTAPGDFAGRAKRTANRRLRRGAIVVAALVVLVASCGVPPSDTHTITGTSAGGTVTDLRYDDDSYYVTTASCTGAFLGCTTDWYGAFTLGTSVDPSALRVQYIGKNAGAGWQFVSVWDWGTMSWFPIDAFRIVAGDEVTVDRSLPTTGTWLTNKGVGFVRVTTIGNLSSSSADLLLGCAGDCSVYSG